MPGILFYQYPVVHMRNTGQVLWKFLMAMRLRKNSAAVFPDAGSGFTALGFPDLPFTAEPSGCPFFPPERDFRDEVSFRPWDQFPKESHQFREIVTEVSFS